MHLSPNSISTAFGERGSSFANHPQIERRLYAVILAKCHELKCEMVALGGVDVHVQLLVRFPTTLAVATLLKEVKGASSHFMTHEIPPGEFFKWQGAYCMFTVKKDEVKTVNSLFWRFAVREVVFVVIALVLPYPLPVHRERMGGWVRSYGDGMTDK